MKLLPSVSLRLAAVLAVFGLPGAALHATTQFQGWCSQVKIQIVQELALERTGFEATLTVTNNDGADAITDFLAELTFEDPTVTDPEANPDAANLFFVRQPTLENINRVDGTGVIAPTKTAVVKWFIIPTIGAGGTQPQGRQFRIGCNLSGKLQGVEIPRDNMFAIPDTIVVKPEPQLRITYFQPRDVLGDDPFTVDVVESPIPFTLGVLVHNHGFGPARNLRINSQQPKIVENLNGLLLVARLLGARVNDSALDESSLLVDFGTLQPTQTGKGAWDMITSLNGTFTDFRASYTHASELGGEATSIITDLDAHFIAHEVLNDDPGRDAIKDFLADVDRDANEIPDAIYETQEGNILPVNHQQAANVTGSLAGNDVQVEIVSEFENWIYLRVPDPGQNRRPISRVVRSDGKVINPNNYWTHTKYTRIGNNRLDWLNLLDKVADNTAYSYQLTYDLDGSDDLPPLTRIRFSGEHSESGGIHHITRDTQIFFTSEDASPVAIEYRINAGSYIPALPFTIQESGTYTITFRATDASGNVEAEKTAVVAISGAGPVIASYGVNVGHLFLPGSSNVVSVRPGRSELQFSVAPNALRVDGQIDIFRGVVAWPRLAGVPPTPTPQDTAELTVSGDYVDFYRYQINGGSWNPEQPVSAPISLAGLSGDIVLRVLARSSHGNYLPEEDALEVTWTVSPTAPLLQVAGLPASPMPAPNAVTLTFSGGAELTDYRWNLNNTFYQAERPIAEPLALTALDPGPQVLGLRGKRSGVWQETEAASFLHWTYDPTYGSDLDSLPLVKSQTYEDIAGQTLSNLWDGRNDAGVPQLPGVYTVRLRLTDSLGRVSYDSDLVFIEKLSSGETQLGAAGASRPDARGAWAVWQQQVDGVPAIRARNLVTSASRDLTSSPLAQEQPRTDGRYAIWQGRGENGVFDVFYADLHAADPQPLAVTQTPGRDEVNPVIHWPWVVYQTRPAPADGAPWQLEARHLETDAVLVVDASSQDQLNPSLHAGRVVWQDWRDVGPGEIYFADLETGERRRITTQPAGQYHPTLFGHQIVWQDNRHTQLELYRFDLRKGREERLTDTPYNEVNPRLSGNWLTYLEDSLGAEIENLRLLDLDSGESVPLTQADGRHSPGALGDGYAVWAQGPAGAQTVVASFLPSLQPVMRNHNTVVITPDLAARYDSAFELLTDWQAAANVLSITRYESISTPPVTQTATWTEGAAAGDDFPIAAGQFLWIRFDQARLLELGAAEAAPVDLAAGKNVLCYSAFPVGYSAFDFIQDVGPANVGALRMLDPLAGVWRAIEVRDGAPVGSNFAIPRVTALLVDMKTPVADWQP